MTTEGIRVCSRRRPYIKTCLVTAVVHIKSFTLLLEMARMHQIIAAAALCLLSGQSALAAPLASQNLAVDLGYGTYQGVYNATTQLNVWKGYVVRVIHRQGFEAS